jgi:hypothetical protein
MGKLIANKAVYFVVLTLFTLAFTWNLAHGTVLLKPLCYVVTPVLSNLPGALLVATGPTIPPPVDEDIRIATGPTIPPPVDEDIRIATGPTIPPPVDEDIRIATGPTIPPPVDEDIRIAA